MPRMKESVSLTVKMPESLSAENVTSCELTDELLAELAKECSVNPKRVRHVEPSPRTAASGDYVIYWATSSCRIQQNEGLALAMRTAEKLDAPLFVIASIDTGSLAGVSKRMVLFLLQCCVDFENHLRILGVPMFVRVEHNGSSILGRSPCSFDTREHDSSSSPMRGFASRARVVVTDERFMPREKTVLSTVADGIRCPLVAVNTATMLSDSFFDGVGPMESREARDELASRISSFRCAVARGMDDSAVLKYDGRPPSDDLVEELRKIATSGLSTIFSAKDWVSPANADIVATCLAARGFDSGGVMVNTSFQGGEGAGIQMLSDFILKGVETYGTKATNCGLRVPREQCGSYMSPYLSAGCTSVHTVATRLIRDSDTSMLPDGYVRRWSEKGAHPSDEEGKVKDRDDTRTEDSSAEAETPQTSHYFESLARREFAYWNAYYTRNHDHFEVLMPKWILTWFKDREKHDDNHHKTVNWSAEEWARGVTPCGRFNSIMKTLRIRGLCHHPDRVYWCQYIADCEDSIEGAYKKIIRLNNMFMIDGPSPNAAASIAAALGKFQIPCEFNSSDRAENTVRNSIYATSIHCVFSRKDEFDTVVGLPGKYFSGNLELLIEEAMDNA